MENFIRNKFPDYKFFYVLLLNQRLIVHLEFLKTILFYRNDGSIKDYYEDKMLCFSFLMYIKKKCFF